MERTASSSSTRRIVVWPPGRLSHSLPRTSFIMKLIKRLVFRLGQRELRSDLEEIALLCALPLGGNQAGPNRESNQTRHIVDIQAGHELKTVGFDCLNTDVEQAGDFLCVFSFGNELQDLALARRELFQRTFFFSRTLKIALHDRPRDRRTKISLALGNRVDGQLQLLGGRLFEHVAGGAG